MEIKNICKLEDVIDMATLLGDNETSDDFLFEAISFSSKEGEEKAGIITNTCKYHDMKNIEFDSINLEIYDGKSFKRKTHKDTLNFYKDGKCLVEINKGDFLRTYFWVSCFTKGRNKISDIKGYFYEIFFNIEKIFKADEKLCFQVSIKNFGSKKGFFCSKELSYREEWSKGLLPLFDKDMPTDFVFLKSEAFQYVKPREGFILNRNRLKEINSSFKENLGDIKNDKYPEKTRRFFIPPEESFTWEKLFEIIDEVYEKSIEKYLLHHIVMDTVSNIKYREVEDNRNKKRFKITFSTGFYSAEIYFYPESISEQPKEKGLRYSFDDGYSLLDFIKLFQESSIGNKNRYSAKLDLITTIPIIR